MKIIFAGRKLLNLAVYLITRVMFLFIFIKKRNIKHRSLFLVRLDSIGDYMLLRNYFEILRKSKKYSGYEITLCGNILWKDLAETFDKPSFDRFIWLNRKKFYSNLIYRYKVLKEISIYGYETAIDVTYTREILFGDMLVKATRATERIGSEGSLDSYIKWKRTLFTDSIYTRLIPADTTNLFEFYRNREFFEQLLGEKISLQKLQIDASGVEFSTSLSEPYIVIVPGASTAIKRWNPANFTSVIENSRRKFPFNFVICGSKDESVIAEQIIQLSGNYKLLNLCGKLSLSQLAKIVSQTSLLISNETGTIHIAAATGNPFVCISNGITYGRFHPYPAELFDKAIFVYPPEMKAHFNDPNYLEENFRFGSELDINSVTVQDVSEAVDMQIATILEKKNIV